MKKIITKTLIVAFLMMAGLQLMAQEIPTLSQAPPPDKEAADVKSIFSDAYTDIVTGISFTGTGTNSITTPFAGDEMIHILSGLNFWTNINLSGEVNIDDMDFLHLDIFLENVNASELKIRFDAATSVTFNVSPGWNSLDFLLDDFRSLEIPTDFTQLGSIQLIRPGGYARTIYVDNIYAYNESSTDPVDPSDPVIDSAPIPAHDAGEVVSVFSDAYTNVAGIEPSDLEGVTVEVLAISEGDNAVKVTGGLGGWTYIHFDQVVDIDDKEFIHFDVYLDESVTLFTGKVRFDGSSGLQFPFEFVHGWNSVDVALQDIRDLSLPVDFSQLGSLALINAGGYPRDVFVDNIYAYGGTSDPVVPDYPTDPNPPVAAPAPEHLAAEVISLFSDAYTNVAGIESVDLGEVLAISENDHAVKMTDGLSGWTYINFDQVVDIDEKEFIHFDVYLDESVTVFTGKARFNGSSGFQFPLEFVHGWNSVDVALQDVRDLALAIDFSQLEKIGFINSNGGMRTVYIDNIYAYSGTSDPVDPDPVIPTDPNAPESAATPEHPEADVTSFFSDTYTDVTTISVNNVGVPALTMEYVVNATDDELMSVKGLNWGMFRLDNYPWSISAEKDYLHLDVYLPGTSASIRVGLGNWTQVNSSQYALVQGWNTIDIPLDVYRDGGVNMDDLIIIKLSSGNGFAIPQLYFDNIYAYAGIPTGGLPPSFEISGANQPIMAPATVKSLFTEKYPNFVELDVLSVTGATKFTIQPLTQEDHVLKLVDLEEASVGAATVFDINNMDALHFNIYYSTAGDEGALEIGLESGAVKVYSTVIPTLNENGWSYVNISLDEFRNAGIDCSAIDNIVFRGAGNLYIDNIFAFKGEYALGKAEEGPIEVDWATASQADVLPDRDRAFLGINLSTGAGGTTPGIYNTSYSYPTFEDLHYYKSKGVRLIRLPFKWERVQHDVGGELDMALDVAKLTEVIAEAERIGMYVMPDMHNYCRRYVGEVKYKFGEASLTEAHYADVWTKLAQEWKDFDNIWGYDIMNEPYGLDPGVWASYAQAAITGIRSVDTETPIVIEGQSYASASTWLQTGAPLFDQLTDPNDNLIWQAHTYFDANKSGQYGGTFDEEVSSSSMPIARIKPFVDWLKATNQRGILGEFGVPRDDVRWLHLLDEVLAYLKENQVSATYWVGGSWYEQNSLGVQPLQNYTIERTPMRVLGEYFPDFHIEDDPSTGLFDAVSNTGFHAFPNPVHGDLTIETGVDMKVIQIYNYTGQAVKSIISVKGNRAIVSMRDLPKGIYILNVQLEDGSFASEKVVKL